MMSKQHHILLVDDSENDRFLMQKAMKKAEFNLELHEASNGDQAIAYLQGNGIYGDRTRFPLPAVMLLDLNMPMKNGFDVLAWVRSQPSLKRLSIIVMTASMRPEDIEKAFDLGANSYLVKPSSIESLANMIRCLRDWIHINHFPPLNEAVRH